MAGNETAVHSYRIVTVSSRLRGHDHPERSLLFSELIRAAYVDRKIKHAGRPCS